MDLFYLNKEIKEKDRLQIFKDFVDAEINMIEYEGDDHPSVICHRHLITILIGKNLVNTLLKNISEIDYNSFYNKESNSYPDNFYIKLLNQIVKKAQEELECLI
jgi:hypothetical protein